MDEILGLLDTIEAKFQELENAVNNVLGMIPGWASWVADRLRDAWNYLCEQATKFWNWLSGILGNMGDPSALTSTASSWSTAVGGTVSGQVQVAEAGNLEVDDTWVGDAADRYRQRISLHKAALDGIKKSMTDGLSSALDTVKSGIFVFWGAVAIALTALVVGLITAIASTATVFGAPAGPFIAAAAILVCLTAMTVGGVKLKSDCQSARTDLDKRISDNSAYLDGHWPKGAVS